MKKRQFILVLILFICIAYGFSWADEIHNAARAGDLAKVKALIGKNPGLINSRDKNGQTPLHIAASWDDGEIARFLVEKGADINAPDNNSNTPLFCAVSTGSKNVAAFLEKKGAKIILKGRATPTPASTPAEAGSPEQAVKSFFSYIFTNQDGKAWEILTETSRKRFCELIAQKTGKDYTWVRAEMDNPNSEMSRGFWNSSRKEFKPAFDRGRLQLKDNGQNPTTAVIQYDGKTMQLKVYKENGEWKIGLIESAEGK